jgi:DNA-binding MarR family transcriptional regulator/GNAT superfamily N-acetyltransferase
MKASPSVVSAAQIRALRGFNRFYTQRIGMLAPYLGSDLSLTQVRVLYELGHRYDVTASELVRDLTLDAGYLSRTLRGFQTLGWLQRRPAPADARQTLLRLSPAGYAAFAPLQQQSRDEAARMLHRLTSAERSQLIDAMNKVRRLLEPGASAVQPATLREPAPGDLGWVVMQHGKIYAHEYGLNWEFEALVAKVAASWIENFRPARDRGWIAEIDGERVGSVFVLQKASTVAQLRLLLLTAAARGQGLGARLVDECIAFARSKDYRKLVLGTQSQLVAARALYQSRGFLLKESERARTYGQDLVHETWELRL